MKSKNLFKSLAARIKRGRAFDKKLATAYVSLFLVMVLIATACFAWFAERYTAQLNSMELEFQSASSLRINKDKYSANKIEIPAFTLDEASSLDGRNIYFPLDKSFTGNTADMFFREGNKGDENVHYVYKDFELKGTSGNTPVYIKSYEIKIEEADTPHDTDVNATYHDQFTIGYDGQGRPNSQTIPHHQCPIRLAFIADSGIKPVVIDPSAQEITYVDNSPGVVSMVDDSGVPELQPSFPDYNWNSFATYYYGNTPLFIIPGGETLNVTLVVWLEGTLPECDKYIGKKISVDIDIESNFVEMDTITFYDDSQPDKTGGQTHWVSNDNPIVACSYEDPFSEENPKRWKTVIMTKTADYTWQAKIPKKAVTNISFYRVEQANGSAQGTIYNAWHTTENITTWATASQIQDGWYIAQSSIPSGWTIASNTVRLQTTRQVFDSSTNTYNNALVYTAVHGNGYSKTTVTSQRLAPCVGYWNYSDVSGGSGGGESGGSSTAESYDVCVTAKVKTWVTQNVNSGSVLHFKTSSGGDYSFSSHSGDTFEQHFNLNNGDEITGFYPQHLSGSKTNLSVSQIFTVTRNVNVVFTQQENDTMKPNLLS